MQFTLDNKIRHIQQKRDNFISHFISFQINSFSMTTFETNEIPINQA